MTKNVGIWSENAEQLTANLRHYFRCRLQSRAEADDPAQDVFVRLLAQRDHQRIGIGYVFTTARNLLRDRARRDAVRKHCGYDGDDDRQNLSYDAIDEVTPERVLIGKDSQKRLILTLGKLDERSRTIIILKRLDGLSNRQIADRMGISVSAVEKRAANAMARIAREIEP